MSPLAPEAVSRLQRARLHLSLKDPWLGRWAAELSLAGDSERITDTLACDGHHLYANADFVARQDDDSLVFLLAHVLLHQLLGHFFRPARRDPRRWNEACDRYVNRLLAQAGFSRPQIAGAVGRASSVEAEFDSLPQTICRSGVDEHWQVRAGPPPEAKAVASGRRPQADDDGRAAQAEEAESSADALAERFQEAIREASGRGEGRSSLLQVLREQQGGAGQDWRYLLERYLLRLARTDFSYQRPSRREGEAILPVLRQRQPLLVLALDISASITESQYRLFVQELQGLKAQINAELILLPCDVRLAEGAPWHFMPGQPLRLPELHGGGGTDFVPVFDWVAHQGLTPDALLYFTDGDGRYPAMAPAYPVLWVLSGNRRPPWGESLGLTG